MEKVYFDSRSEKFKKPFGSVKNNEEIIFNIYVSSDLSPKKVCFVLREDEKEESIYMYMQKTDKYDNFDIFSLSVTIEKTGLYFYRFEITTPDGIKYIGLNDEKAQIGEWLPEWQLTVYSKDFKTPEWVYGGIMYQIFPDRFAKSDDYIVKETKNERKIHENWDEIPDFIYNVPDYKANDYFCGNLKGIAEKLDYIKSLGVNIIYLNPVFESSENHRYSTSDYMKIDPYLGSNDDFIHLVKECNKKGIKIILDGVFSHTGADSVYFNKYNHYDSIGAYNSKNSPYYDWYSFREYPNEYESWWGFENLPNVKELTPSYLDFITGENGVISYWQGLGAFGWRLDVADELPDKFLDMLYSRSKQENNDSFVIGEIWEDATNKFAYGKRRKYLLGGQMDSVMNYPFRTAILDFIKNKDVKIFSNRIMTILENYPPPVINCLMNSISTHDTVRAITFLGVNHEVDERDKGKYILTSEEYAYGKKMLLLAVFLQFTLPGIPSIYYGDEVGLSGFRDPYSRKTYPYGNEDIHILDFYKKIAKLRVNHKKEFSGSFNEYKKENGFYSFFRENLLCGINLSEDRIEIESNSFEIIFMHGDIYYIGNKIVLPSESCIILKKES